MGKRIHNMLALALKNSQRKQLRSISLILIVAIFTFALFSVSLLVTNLQNGLTITAKRFGADLMIVPEGYESDFEGVLLKSEPSTFYFSGDIETQVANIPGVAQCSSQLFLESLNAECCSVPVQMIAFDMDKDFTITPWLEESFSGELGLSEIIIGSLVEAQVNDTLIFYGQSFTVVGVMSETGTGLDSSIYMTRETAYEMCREAAGIALQDMNDTVGRISCVMVKAADGEELQQLAERITSTVDGTEVIVTESLIGSLTGHLNNIAKILYIIIVLLWVVAVIVLLVIFNSMIHERRGEFGLYRALGFSRKMLQELISCESVLISAVGALAGIAVGSLIVFPFQNLISSSLKLPYLNSSMGTVFEFIALSLVVSVVTVLAVGVIESKKIGKSETFLLMRERI